MPVVSDFRLEASLRALLSELAAFFAASQAEAYATGGFLRDTLLGLPLSDIDISIGGDPLELGRRLGDTFRGHYFPLDEEKRLVRVILPDHGVHLDLQPLRGPIEDDLKRRDYTIDAMAAPLAGVAAGSIVLIDPAGGLEDLHRGFVRVVREDAFREDPLRMLRGVRLATQLDFAVEPLTAELIRRHASAIAGVAAERQREELMYCLSTPRAAQGLRLMDSLGLFRHVLPEMEVARNVQQPKEHHWDVFEHCMQTVACLDALLAEEEPDQRPARLLWRELWTKLGWWSGARRYFREEFARGTPRSALLKLGALLHDIGKPETKSFDKSGRMRFFGHADAGAGIAQRLLRRLHFSTREVAVVRAMIEAHLRPLQMAQQGPPSDRAIYRFFRDTDEAGIDTLFLSLADGLATVGPRPEMEGWRQHVALVNYILTKRLQQPALSQPPKLLRGDELMSELRLSPGPLVGQLLEMVREAQAAGEVNTKEEALALARSALAAPRASRPTSEAPK